MFYEAQPIYCNAINVKSDKAQQNALKSQDKQVVRIHTTTILKLYQNIN